MLLLLYEVTKIRKKMRVYVPPTVQLRTIYLYFKRDQLSVNIIVAVDEAEEFHSLLTTNCHFRAL